MWTMAFALLKRIPVRDYLYLAAIVLTMSVGWWFVQHERAIGARDAQIKLEQMKIEYDHRTLELQAKNNELLQQAQARSMQVSKELTQQQGAVHALSTSNTALLERLRVLLHAQAPTGNLSADPASAPGGLSAGALSDVQSELYSELAGRASAYAEEADLCRGKLTKAIELYEAIRVDLSKP